MPYNLRTRSITPHDFAMNPDPQVERSSFPIRKRHSTTFGASYLVPIFVAPTNPGDMWNVRVDAVARTATPIVPILDNWTMSIHFWYVANRNLWTNWEKFMGEQINPGDSISYTVPRVTGPTNGWPACSLGDYMGLGVVGQITAAARQDVNALPLRAYNSIYNEHYRDENLQNWFGPAFPSGDGPDSNTSYQLQVRGKRPDYFTGALPWPQKGNAVTISLGTTAPVIGVAGAAINFMDAGGVVRNIALTSASTAVVLASPAGTSGNMRLSTGTTNMVADLTTASAITINTLRTAIATQELLERDARGGTRYNETIFAHWKVRVPDFRLDRPEFLGGGQIKVNVDAIPQTSATGLTGGTTPAGSLAATGYADGKTGFTYAAQEHGYILGLATVQADLTYTQGLERHWTRSTRFDFPYPELAHLGEQGIYNKEIYAVGSATGGEAPADQDMQIFGYIPRYDEERWFPSMMTGLFRPKTTGNIAYWHSSQLFGSLPTLNSTFISDDTKTVLQRNLAAGALADNQQFLTDFLFTGRVAKPLPTHAIPGLTRF